MTLQILDTRGLLMRDYHGCSYKSLVTAEGPVTSWQDGLSSFVDRTLFPLLVNTPPRKVIAVFDGGNNSRRAMYPQYKSARRARDSAVSKIESEQKDEMMTKARRLMSYLGVRCLVTPGEEADDTIALLCHSLDRPKVVHTKDGDLIQLAALDDVTVLQYGNSASVTVYNKQYPGVPDYNGLPFDLIPLHKSIVGDSSDGYPGVTGCGPKFFDDIQARFGIDGLYQLNDIVKTGNRALLDGTGDKSLDKLFGQFGEWSLSYRLATVDPSFCYGQINGRPKLPQWQVRLPNTQKVYECLDELHLSHRISEISRYLPVQLLLGYSQADQLQAYMQQIMTSEIVSYDFESSDKLQHAPFQKATKGMYVDVLSQELAGISINFGDNNQYTIYVPFDHKDTDNYPKEWAVWILKSLHARATRPVVQNAAFELSVAKTDLGVDLPAPYDTAILASYADENEEGGLKDNALSWFNYRQITYKEVTKGRMMCEVTGEEVLQYGCDDSFVTSHLFDIKKHILQMERMWEFYNTYEVNAIVDDVNVFIDGTDVDQNQMAALWELAEQKIGSSEELVYSNLTEYATSKPDSSRQQLAVALLNEWWETEQFKHQDNPDKRNELYQKLWARAWRGCAYVPAPERTPAGVSVGFAPTAAKVNKLLEVIDPQAPQLTKLTQSALSDWDLSMSDYLAALEANLRKSMPTEQGSIDNFEDLKELHEKLWAARMLLNKKVGQPYIALSEFCNRVWIARMPVKVAKSAKTPVGKLNFASTVQMQQLLYGMLELPIRRRSKMQKGSLRDVRKLKRPPATGLKAIAAAFVYDVGSDDWRREVLLAYRDIALTQQEISLFYQKYPNLVHPRDGKMHPQFKNCGTATRRPSGTAPNDLQVSKKDGAKIRKCYLGGDYGDGQRIFISADFVGQELVITACESRDAVMLDAFTSNPRKDLHSLTSSGFANILLPRLGFPIIDELDYAKFMSIYKEEETELQKALDEIRGKYGKPVNFLIVYGGGYTTLAENLLIPEELAKEIMNNTFKTYPGLEPWQRNTAEFARRHGYTLTAYGNRRHASPDLWSDDRGLATRQERQLINATIQGTAADILKVVREEMVRRNMRTKYRMKAVKQVYDEITASVPLEAAADYAEELIEVMSVIPPGYPVGMLVDVSFGKTWGDVKKSKSNSREHLEAAVSSIEF